ncbi:hypothetical protein V866_004055 [Kwoniella sp. B9012]
MHNPIDRLSTFWTVRIYGKDESLIQGITGLCGLPPRTLFDDMFHFQHRHHRPESFIHPTYTSMEFPVYGTLISIRQAAHQAEFGNSQASDLPEKPDISKQALANAVVDEMIQKGLINVYIIPSSNVVITITPRSYACPSTGMTEYAAQIPLNIPGEMEMSINAELLGVSLLHRSIGNASNTVRDITAVMKVWENDARLYYSTTRATEVHRLTAHLITFRNELQDLLKVHERLLTHYRGQDEQGLVSEMLVVGVPAGVVVIVEQSQHGLHRVLIDLQRLIDRGTRLEAFCLNMLSSRANESMERLAIVTIVFLPLTFIASYFSMAIPAIFPSSHNEDIQTGQSQEGLQKVAQLVVGQKVQKEYQELPERLFERLYTVSIDATA